MQWESNINKLQCRLDGDCDWWGKSQASFKNLLRDFHIIQKWMKTNGCLEQQWQCIQKSKTAKNAFEKGQQNVKYTWFIVSTWQSTFFFPGKEKPQLTVSCEWAASGSCFQCLAALRLIPSKDKRRSWLLSFDLIFSSLFRQNNSKQT